MVASTALGITDTWCGEILERNTVFSLLKKEEEAKWNYSTHMMALALKKQNKTSSAKTNQDWNISKSFWQFGNRRGYYCTVLGWVIRLHKFVLILTLEVVYLNFIQIGSCFQFYLRLRLFYCPDCAVSLLDCYACIKTINNNCQYTASNQHAVLFGQTVNKTIWW